MSSERRQSGGSPPPGFVKSFARGLSVIKVFGQQQAPLTITEVAECAGLTRAGARRLLLTLQELGYVKLHGRHFSLTPRLTELGGAYRAADPLWEIAERQLQSLVDEVNETASAGVLDDLHLVYVLRLRTIRPLHLDLRPGSRLPAHVSSLGRVLLADLHPRQLERYFQRATFERYTPLTITQPAKLRAVIESVQAGGYAVVTGEIDEGICGIAVPLRDQTGKARAAIGVSMVRSPTLEVDITRIVPRLQAAAMSISAQLQQPN